MLRRFQKKNPWFISLDPIIKFGTRIIIQYYNHWWLENLIVHKQLLQFQPRGFRVVLQATWCWRRRRLHLVDLGECGVRCCSSLRDSQHTMYLWAMAGTFLNYISQVPWITPVVVGSYSSRLWCSSILLKKLCIIWIFYLITADLKTWL